MSTQKSFWRIQEWLTFFFYVPLSLFLLYLLPSSIKDTFILKPSSPTLISIFASNFIHSTLNHLIGNLFFYFWAVFLIFNLEFNKKDFTSGYLHVL